MIRWAGQPLPLSATCFVGNVLHVRLSGAATAVSAAQRRLGGDELEDAGGFWRSIREHTHPFFKQCAALWRFSLKATSAPLGLGPSLLEWNGSLRWTAAEIDPGKAYDAAEQIRGHATMFRGPNKSAGIQRLPEPLLVVHKKLKRALDPIGLFGPGRLHPEF
jgi:glycolate oxidase FAD binding subunit